MNIELAKLLKEQKEFINRDLPLIWYPSSLPSLNKMLGGKGLRGGRMHQLIGEKSTGKSTLALDFLAQEQKRGNVVAYIDFERTFDPDYATILGVDFHPDKFILVKVDTGEQGLHLSESLIQAGVTAIVIDSVPAAMPSSENEKELSNSAKMAASAGLITRWCRRIVNMLDNRGALCIVINQNRANFSQMSPKETKPYGPKQLQYSVSTTLELRRIKNEDDQSIVQIFTEKNKQGGTERQKQDIVITYGLGLDVAYDVLMLAVEQNIVEKKGAWYYYQDLKCQGIEQAKEKLPIDKIRGLINV